MFEFWDKFLHDAVTFGATLATIFLMIIMGFIAWYAMKED